MIKKTYLRKGDSKKIFLRAAFKRMLHYVEKNYKAYNYTTSRWDIIKNYCECLNIDKPFRKQKNNFALAEYVREGSPIFSGMKGLPSFPTSKKKIKKRKKPKKLSQEYLDYLNSPEWKNFKHSLIIVRGRKCEKCGIENKVLDGHHLTYKRFMNELPEDILLLCRKCHDEIHKQKTRTNERILSA